MWIQAGVIAYSFMAGFMFQSMMLDIACRGIVQGRPRRVSFRGAILAMMCAILWPLGMFVWSYRRGRSTEGDVEALVRQWRETGARLRDAKEKEG